MDERMKELVAVGAAAAANCHPCMDHHLAKCDELDVSREEVIAAADLLKRQLPAVVVQLLEPVKAVAAVPHDLTGLAHVAGAGDIAPPTASPPLSSDSSN
jgi:AhpD family alkylhydroperoxidase